MSEPIVVERHVAADPAVVYSYFVDSAKWVRWQGVDAEVDAQPGGSFAVTMPDGARAQGSFMELDPHRRVVFSWGWLGHDGLPPGSSTVEVELIADEAGTLVRLTHWGVPPEEMDLHSAGWNRYLSRLVEVAGGGEPEPDTVAS